VSWFYDSRYLQKASPWQETDMRPRQSKKLYLRNISSVTIGGILATKTRVIFFAGGFISSWWRQQKIHQTQPQKQIQIESQIQIINSSSQE
jgi:uncharacterized PurR-regulated membrane protein YhhQ (DUF165 family)